VFIAAALLANGCADPTRNGVVVSEGQLVLGRGNRAPVIPIRRPDGKIVRLGDAAYPFFVVGFVQPRGDDACRLSPRLLNLNKSLEIDAISLVQVTLPTKLAPLLVEPGECPDPPWNMIRLLDPDELAWSAFGEPEPGTLLLIDRFGYIVARGHLDDPDYILWRARELQEDWELYQNEGMDQIPSNWDW
jgi:hypothetical protein